MRGYELGAWVETPQSIADYIRHIEVGANALEADIVSTNCFPYMERLVWEHWIANFRAFVSDHEGVWPRLWGSAMDSAERWADELDQWRDKFQQFCGRLPSGVELAPPSPHESKQGVNTNKILLAAGIIGVPLAGLLIYRMVAK